MAPLSSEMVKREARAAGFDAAGIARAEPLDPAPLDRVLAKGWQADMAWLGAQRAERLDPGRLLPGAKSVVALALRYAQPRPPQPPGTAKVASFAWGRDYHRVVERKLWKLAARLAELDPGVRSFASVDIAPVMEKAWAQRAGLGWIGKNGLLVTPEHGSFVYLATLLVDRELAPDAPHPDRCGSCSACLPACPTGALAEPRYVDARRCISYFTIEQRGPVAPEARGELHGWILGCDDCQTACPWNRAEEGAPLDPDLAPRDGQSALDLDAALALSEDDYKRRFFGTSLARARYDGLLRNAVLAAAATRDRRYAPAIERLASSPHPGVAEAARWALEVLI